MATEGFQTREVRRFHNVPAPQTIVTGATAAVSSAITANEVLMTTTTDCFFLIGADPTVTASNGHFMPAGSSWPALIKPGDKVSVISPGGAGAFYISTIG
jgi:hypothetical protein